MRLRRGNYAILFVLTAAVLMSYLAFSIDGGRMKVALIQAENGAETAAITAMAVLRAGGSAEEARVAGAAAAQEVRLQGMGGTTKKTQAYSDIDTRFGKWNWLEQGEAPDLSFRWHDNDGQDRQAVTVNVLVNDGVKSVFGPAIGMLNHADRWGSNVSGEEKDRSKYAKFQVKVGARAAFRHRDMYVLLDVSRANEKNKDAVAAALAQFVDTMRAYDVPGDRLGLMAYAGESWVYDLSNTDVGGVLDPSSMTIEGYVGPGEPSQPFYPLTTFGAEAREVVQNVEPCYVGDDAWFYWYRHMLIGEDTELNYYTDVAGSFEYWLVGPPTNSGTIRDVIRLNENDLRLSFTFQFLNLWATYAVPDCRNLAEAGKICPYFTNLAQSEQTLSKFEQCTAWRASETLFTTWDRRRWTTLETGRRSPLACHDGNFFESRSVADRVWTGSRVIDGRDCNYSGDPGFGVDAFGNATPRYGRESEEYAPDQAYTMAGSWPGRALSRARASFINRQVRSAEANVVLITASAPNCGPLIGDTWGATCKDQVEGEALDAVRALQQDGNVNLYVVGLVPPGSVEESKLSAWGDVGRGWYSTVSDSAQLPFELRRIARDMKIQVVQ